MKAMCVNCLNAVEFHNKRGNKLADMKCECGGELKRASIHHYQDTKFPEPPNVSYWYYTVGKIKYLLNKDKNKFEVLTSDK